MNDSPTNVETGRYLQWRSTSAAGGSGTEGSRRSRRVKCVFIRNGSPQSDFSCALKEGAYPLPQLSAAIWCTGDSAQFCAPLRSDWQGRAHFILFFAPCVEPRRRLKQNSARQPLALTVTGCASLKVSEVSGGILTSFFPVISAAAVPAHAPMGPPIRTPLPPAAIAPMRAPPPAPPAISSTFRFLCLPPTLV